MMIRISMSYMITTMQCVEFEQISPGLCCRTQISE